MRRILAAIISVYLVLLAGGLSWHWSSEPPYARPTIGLLLAVGVIAALVGLISIWCAFAATHWSERASGLIAGSAVLVAVPTLFFEWDNSLVWQLLVIVYVQLAALIMASVQCASLAARSRIVPGFQRAAGGKGTRATQFTVRNLFLITSALALLFGVIHFIRPIELGGTLYEILVCGGFCAAFVSLVTLWASFSKLHVVIRLVALLVAAPAGGICYRAMSNYLPMLMSSEFYAAVTAVQVVCMALPLAIIRLAGYRFCSSKSRTSN